MVQRVAGAGLGPPALHFYLCGHEARLACRLAMHALEAAWPGQLLDTGSWRIGFAAFLNMRL